MGLRNGGAEGELGAPDLHNGNTTRLAQGTSHPGRKSARRDQDLGLRGDLTGRRSQLVTGERHMFRRYGGGGRDRPEAACPPGSRSPPAQPAALTQYRNSSRGEAVQR